MWRNQIVKLWDQYTDEEKTLCQQMVDDIYATAARLNVTLPGNQAVANSLPSQSVPATLLGASTSSTLPSVSVSIAALVASDLSDALKSTSASNVPTVEGTSTNNVQPGKAAPSLKKSKAAPASRKRKAPTSFPESIRPPPSKQRLHDSQSGSRRRSKRTQTIATYNESGEASEPESDDEEVEAAANLHGAQAQDIPQRFDAGYDSDCIVVATRKHLPNVQSNEEMQDDQQAQQSRSRETASASHADVNDEVVDMEDFDATGSNVGAASEENVGEEQGQETDGKGSSVVEELVDHTAAGNNKNGAMDIDTAADLNIQPPTAEVNPTPSTLDGESLEGRSGYDIWRDHELDRILLRSEVTHLYPPPPKDPNPEKSKPTDEKVSEPMPDPSPLHPYDRVLNFFEHMFGGHRGDIRRVLDNASEIDRSWREGEYLAFVYGTLRRILKVEPRYELVNVFSSSNSPFANFALATKAHSRKLRMLHRSDVRFGGPGGASVELFTVRLNVPTLTVNEVFFVDEDDPVFKRSGRVYTAQIQQPAKGILGDFVQFNTASVRLHVMLCDSEACAKCSPDGVTDTSEASGLPRVHNRHVSSDNIFTEDDPYVYGLLNEDSGGEFPDYAPTLPTEVEFWDGSKQNVVTCLGHKCMTCMEARSSKNMNTPTLEQYRPALQQKREEEEQKKKKAAAARRARKNR